MSCMRNTSFGGVNYLEALGCIFINHISKKLITRFLCNRDHFAGGMKLVSLYSIVQNKRVRRNLNDKNFTVESRGVAFDKCLGEVSSEINR